MCVSQGDTGFIKTCYAGHLPVVEVLLRADRALVLAQKDNLGVWLP